MTHDFSAFAESNPDYRANLAARMAIRAFGDGVRAADWLVQPNELFAGFSPLFMAKESVSGCARVCQALDDFVPRRPAQPFVARSEGKRRTASQLRRRYFR
jgi:hypothetical protein